MLNIIEINSKAQNGNIDVDHNAIANSVINEKDIVILKSVFDPSMLKSIRNKVFEWGLNTEPSNPAMENFFDASFHRIDNNPPKSKTPHIFHAYNFTNQKSIDFFDDIEKVFLPMKSLQEKLSGTVLNTDPDQDGIAIRPQFIHYPSGGGHFDWHEHPFNPQKVGLILSISEKGEDFNTGGTMFKLNDKECSIESSHEIGDIAMFRYDIIHKISTIDPELDSVNFEDLKGKWSFILPFY